MNHRSISIFTGCAVALLLAFPAAGQMHAHPSPTPASTTPEPSQTSIQGTENASSSHADQDETAANLMRQASGTSTNPEAAPMPMQMFRKNDWTLMLHGSAFINQTWQRGPRGADKFFSTNWIMGMADRKLGGGHLMLRSMLSLEPATITDEEYPLLFQTGETAHGSPLHDAQHPHDFFMELAAEFMHPIGTDAQAYIYVAPVGDPSLGPVAFPHRASAADLPQASLGHHVEDSTHIAFNVLTAGVKIGSFGGAVSGFHGAEPDENRWDIEGGAIDSWAARVTFDPSPNWSGQISTGHLSNPERLEPGDIQRTTVSVSRSAPIDGGMWSSSLIFGHNDKDQGKSNNAWTAETVLQFKEVNYLTARAEQVDKDELFTDEDVPPAIAAASFSVRALTAGYTRDLWNNRWIAGGVGGNVTLFQIPSAIRPYYGNHPMGANLFLRLRSAGGHGAMHMPGM
ncbi:MAG: hypothetical protein ABI718_16380 [Acidobacteriota bacterium]